MQHLSTPLVGYFYLTFHKAVDPMLLKWIWSSNSSVGVWNILGSCIWGGIFNCSACSLRGKFLLIQTLVKMYICKKPHTSIHNAVPWLSYRWPFGHDRVSIPCRVMIFWGWYKICYELCIGGSIDIHTVDIWVFHEAFTSERSHISSPSMSIPDRLCLSHHPVWFYTAYIIIHPPSPIHGWYITC